MEETHASTTEKTAADKPVIHRVCEACNNMFATYPGSKITRCSNCTKEHSKE
ncbi:MAG: zinc finger domain-containing protein [Candidatus Acidiferrales bacterium]